ncbi:MAG: photosystem II stability/assembly factor-like uncharacterized protein [Bermanella sp.]|jgi:photosystem II stability/assembly factor-like uncharacterized protein
MISNFKKASLVGLIVFSAIASANSSYQAPLVKESLLLDIALGDSILIVGERGHILTGTTVQNLTQVAVPTKTTLTAVTLFAQNAWAVGHDASILHSSDAGQTWELQLSMPELDRPFLDVFFKDENTGVAVGAYGLFYRTIDGGVTWQKELHASVLPQDDIDYLDSIKDEPEFYQDELSFILPHFNRLNYANGKLYMAGEAGLLAVSTDFGRSWKRFDIAYNGSFFDIQKTENGQLFAVGLRGNIFLANDDSKKWDKLQTCVTTSLNSVVHGNDNTIYITGNNGVLLSLDQTKVAVNEYYPANDEGCAIHISIKKLKNDLSDSILNGLVINDAMLAVTASGIKQIELK